MFENRAAARGRKIPLRVVVVPGGAHVFYGLEGIGCVDRLSSELVIRGSTEGLDLEGCRESIRRLPFATSLE